MKLHKALLGLAFAAGTAQAQSSASEQAGFAGMLFTPVGALPMIQVSPGGTTDSRTASMAARVGSWRLDQGADRNTTLGGTVFVPVGSLVTLEGTLAWFQPGGSGADGTIMGSVDIQSPLWDSPLSMDNPVSLTIFGRGSLGFGHFTGSGGGNAWSLVAALPLRVRYGLANKSDFSFFFSPGIGFAGVSDEIGSEDGSRPIIAFGGAWTAANGIGVHLGTQQIILDGDPPWVVGLSLSFQLRAKQ